MPDTKPPQTLTRSFALGVCEVCKFSMSLVTDPAGTIGGVVGSEVFRGALLMGGVYYLNNHLQEKRRCNRGSSDRANTLSNDKTPSEPSVTSTKLHPPVAAPAAVLPSPSISPDFVLPSIPSAGYSDVLVIGVAGGSGSGKTTFARAIYKEFGEEHMAYIMHDNYYRDLSHLPHEERDLVNFDHPDQLETSLLVEHIKKLKQRQAVDIPSYDFAGHVRVKDTHRAQPKTLILVEGILIFTDPELFSLLDVKVRVRAGAAVPHLARVCVCLCVRVCVASRACKNRYACVYK